jgi:hypothetical protein
LDVRTWSGRKCRSRRRSRVIAAGLDEIASYRWVPTFAFVHPDGVQAWWELLEALAHYRARQRTKVELFMLLVSPQIGRVVSNSLDTRYLQRAEQQIT